MSTKADRALVIGFVAVLFASSALFVAMPKPSFSELENRYLQKLPTFSWDDLWSKKFGAEMEDYVIDHFPFRDRWVWTKSAAEQLRLRQENNGIYKGKDGYLFERFDEPDDAKVASYADAVNAFAAAHPEARMTFLLAPTSVGVYPDKLPWLAPTYPEQDAFAFIEKRLREGPTFINGMDVLSPHRSESIYYRTDHHWTTYGAYLAYRAYAESMGWTPLTASDFDVETVSDSFLGSFHSKSQFAGISPDAIQSYAPKTKTETSMYVADTDTKTVGLYAREYLSKKDKYSYFLGGVHALTILNSKLDAAEKKLDKLLVVKDSYAHSFLPFLAQQVSEIHVIDLRYYNGSVSGYMEQTGIKDVLFLYNASTFVHSGDIAKLK